MRPKEYCIFFIVIGRPIQSRILGTTHSPTFWPINVPRGACAQGVPIAPPIIPPILVAMQGII